MTARRKYAAQNRYAHLSAVSMSAQHKIYASLSYFLKLCRSVRNKYIVSVQKIGHRNKVKPFRKRL